MLNDVYQDVCDRLVLVSGDSDLVPAVHMVKARFPDKQVIVYVPARNPVRGAAVELRSAADKDRLLPLQLLPKAQFAAQVPDGAGGILTKPSSWWARPPAAVQPAPMLSSADRAQAPQR